MDIFKSLLPTIGMIGFLIAIDPSEDTKVVFGEKGKYVKWVGSFLFLVSVFIWGA